MRKNQYRALEVILTQHNCISQLFIYEYLKMVSDIDCITNRSYRVQTVIVVHIVTHHVGYIIYFGL